MKKGILFLLCCGIIITTSGCGNSSTSSSDNSDSKSSEKTQILSCWDEEEEMEEDYEGILLATGTEYTYDANGKTIKKVQDLAKVDATNNELEFSEVKEEASEFCYTWWYKDEDGERIEHEKADILQDKYTDCDIQTNSRKINIVATYELEKLKKLFEYYEDDEDYGNPFKMSIEELKDYYEETSNATCTIKK